MDKHLTFFALQNKWNQIWSYYKEKLLFDKEEITHILPVFLQQWNKEINAHLHVLEDLFFLHAAVTNSNSHAQHLFQLKLNRRLGLVHLSLKGFLVRNKRWELSCNRKMNKTVKNTFRLNKLIVITYKNMWSRWFRRFQLTDLLCLNQDPTNEGSA